MSNENLSHGWGVIENCQAYVWEAGIKWEGEKNHCQKETGEATFLKNDANLNRILVPHTRIQHVTFRK